MIFVSPDSSDLCDGPRRRGGFQGEANDIDTGNWRAARGRGRGEGQHRRYRGEWMLVALEFACGVLILLVWCMAAKRLLPSVELVCRC